jgi:hypothetical protein
LRNFSGKAVHCPTQKIVVSRRFELLQEDPANVIHYAEMRPASRAKLKMTTQDDRQRRVQRTRGMTHQRFTVGMVTEGRHFSSSTPSRIFS